MHNMHIGGTGYRL